MPLIIKYHFIVTDNHLSILSQIFVGINPRNGKRNRGNNLVTELIKDCEEYQFCSLKNSVREQYVCKHAKETCILVSVWAGTYTDARNRLSKAEETSALGTDDDSVVAATSRNRRRKLQYRDFDYDNHTVVPPPTKSNRVAKSGNSVPLPELPAPPASLTPSVALTSRTGCDTGY